MNRLIEAPCQRCGKVVTTARRSLLGLDAIKRRWGVLCQGCFTLEEERQLLKEQGEAIVQQRRS